MKVGAYQWQISNTALGNSRPVTNEVGPKKKKGGRYLREGYGGRTPAVCPDAPCRLPPRNLLPPTLSPPPYIHPPPPPRRATIKIGSLVAVDGRRRRRRRDGARPAVLRPEVDGDVLSEGVGAATTVLGGGRGEEEEVEELVGDVRCGELCEVWGSGC